MVVYVLEKKSSIQDKEKNLLKKVLSPARQVIYTIGKTTTLFFLKKNM